MIWHFNFVSKISYKFDFVFLFVCRYHSVCIPACRQCPNRGLYMAPNHHWVALSLPYTHNPSDIHTTPYLTSSIIHVCVLIRTNQPLVKHCNTKKRSLQRSTVYNAGANTPFGGRKKRIMICNNGTEWHNYCAGQWCKMVVVVDTQTWVWQLVRK